MTFSEKVVRNVQRLQQLLDNRSKVVICKLRAVETLQHFGSVDAIVIKLFDFGVLVPTSTPNSINARALPK